MTSTERNPMNIYGSPLFPDQKWVYRDTDGIERVLRAGNLQQAEERVIAAETARGVDSIAARNIAARSIRLLSDAQAAES
jgi:hypothetical protein